MKVTIISGSHRLSSQSSKVATFIQQSVKSRFPDASASIIDLAGNPFPLWDEGVWEGEARWEGLLEAPRRQLQASDALVVIAPEWHGQVPAGLKNFFLLFGPAELGHRPALIVTVSSGDGGSYPVAELRMSSYKNSRICYIPEQVIIRGVEGVLNEERSENDPKRDAYLRDRIGWSLDILRAYATALKTVRESDLPLDAYRFGM